MNYELKGVQVSGYIFLIFVMVDVSTLLLPRITRRAVFGKSDQILLVCPLNIKSGHNAV